MKKLSLVMIIVALILFISGCTKQVAIENTEETRKPIGGDKDEHGCLIAAGYSWCEIKQKCLRDWEESCSGECQVDSDCGTVQQCGMTWECSEGTCHQLSKECPKQVGLLENCEDLCGDGVCQEVVCMAIGCPCAETPESCPQDCAK